MNNRDTATERNRLIWNKACTIGFSALLGTTALTGVGHAGPTKCTQSGTSYLCQGNQSGGIEVGVNSGVAANATGVVVQNLTPLSNNAPYTRTIVLWNSTLEGDTNLNVRLQLDDVEYEGANGAAVALSSTAGSSGESGANIDAVVVNGTLSAPSNVAVIGLASTGKSGKGGPTGKGGTKPKNGGSGSPGGAGGLVEFIPSAANNTTKYQNGTIQIQSIAAQGGNGGNGGSSGGVQTSGGSGGIGGAGGAIYVVSEGETVLTGRANLTVTSKGGRGGNGGDAENKDASSGDGGGGNGATGGAGGAIWLDVGRGGSTGTGSWNINSSATAAVLLESTGGDGGTGGRRERRGTGSGGNGGNAGAINLGNVSRSISASGDAALQITGTGGDGGGVGSGTRSDSAHVPGGAGGNGSDVGIEGTWTINGTGSSTDGILVLSQGGTSNDVSFGREDFPAARPGGAGGKIYLRSGGASTVKTTGTGISLQSIGGDAGGGAPGGTGGAGGAITIGKNASGSIGTGSWDITTTGAGHVGLYGLSKGGKGGTGIYDVNGGTAGGTGGHGGSISIVDGPSISVNTSGNSSHAVQLVSAGSNGGQGGDNSEGAFDGTVGAGGAGGDISVSNTFDIATSGQGAHGLFLRSSGGNPGNPGGANKPGGGGTINADIAGTITTTGSSSSGVVTRSLAGDEGKGTATTGATTITVSGTISATGTNGSGIDAITRSFGDTEAGAITVNIEDTGAVKAAGPVLSLGSSGQKTVNGAGSIVSTQGTNGVAIKFSGTGATSVNITGTLTGEIVGENTGDGLGSAQLTIGSGGTVNAGRSMDVDVFNAGLFRSYSGGTVVSGDYVQSEDGETRVASDALSVAPLMISGDAEISGAIGLNLSGSDYLNMLEEQSRTFRIIEAGGSLALDEDATAVGSVVAQPRLSQSSDGAVRLSYDVDFANDTVKARTNNNQDDLVDRIEAAYQRGDLLNLISDEAVVLAAIEDIEDFNSAANSLSGEIYANTQLAALTSAQMFSETLLSCSEREGTYRFVSQGQCVWLHLGAARLSQDANADSSGFSQNTYTVAGGGQYEVWPGTHLGFGLAYQDVSLDMASATSDADVYRLGLTAKQEFGAAAFSAALSGGTGQFDATRRPVTGGEATSAQDISTYSAVLRGEYAMTRGNWSIVPQLDLGIDYVDADGFDETGSSNLSLSGTGSSETFVRLRPAVEFGREHQGTGGTLYRTTFTVGLNQYLTNAAPSVTSNFDFVPDDPSFVSNARLDRTSVDLGARFEVFAWDKISVTGSVATNFSKSSHTVGAALKAQYRF